MIGVVHLGLGNLGSLTRSLGRSKLAYQVVERPEFSDCTKLVFPGVGHFGRACDKLDDNWRAALGEWINAGRPFMGICLGYQLLYEGSDEAPGAQGLGVFSGSCVEVPSQRRPHMGWNRLNTRAGYGQAFDGSWMYFVHSYAPLIHDEVVFTCEDGAALFAVGAFRGAVGGVQFHPEKSHDDGGRLLRSFAEGTL